MLGSVIFNRLPHSFSTQRRSNKKTLCYGLYLHANIAHTKFERVLNDTDSVFTRCAYAQGRVKRLSPSIYIYVCLCVCVGKKHGCLLSYRSKIATK